MRASTGSRIDLAMATLRRAGWGLLAPLAVLAVASLGWGSYHALSNSADLMRRLEEVALVVRGLDPYQDPDMTYPPTAPAVFVPLVAPLAGWPLGLRAAWLGLNLGALGLIGWRIVRTWGARWPLLVSCGFLLAVAASKPVRLSLGMGQFSLIPLALVLLSHEAARRGRPIASGLMLGIALVKPTMVIPFLVVHAVRGHGKALAVAIGAQLVMLAGVSGWLGVPPVRLVEEWLALASGQHAAGLIDVPSVLGRIWPGASNHANLVSLGVLALGALGILAARRAPDAWLQAFAGFVAAVMIYHRPYDLVLLIPALAVFTDEACQASGRSPAAGLAWASAAGVFGALLVAPAHPSVIAESTYEALFIPAAYGILALVAVRVYALSRSAAPEREGAEPAGQSTRRRRPRPDGLGTAPGAGNDPETSAGGSGSACRPPYARADQCGGARDSKAGRAQLFRASS